MTISIIKGNTVNHHRLNLLGLVMRLVELAGDQLHLLGHGHDTLCNCTWAQTLVQLFLDSTKRKFLSAQYNNLKYLVP